jgi:hypothetical protein
MKRTACRSKYHQFDGIQAEQGLAASRSLYVCPVGFLCVELALVWCILASLRYYN